MGRPAAGTYDVIDPATTKVVGRAPEASVEQADDAAAAAKEASVAWKNTSPAERCAAIGRLADEVAKRSADWVPTVQAETGALKKITETLQVGGPAVDRFRYYSNPIDLDESLAPVPVAKGPLGPAGLMSARVKHQPVGVVACITPTTSRSPTWPARLRRRSPPAAPPSSSRRRRIRSASSCSVRRSTPPASRPAWSTS